MNAGAGEAQGDAFWFLHADTRVPETAISALLQALDDGRRWGRFDVRLSGRQATLRLIGFLMNLRSRLSGICTGDQGIFVTREAFNNVGGFPGIALMEDIALTKALRARSRPACLKPALVTSSRRWERAGIWRTVLLMWRLRLAYTLGADPDGLAKRYHP
jgi:rSAM/selenodomain-associated transferase 2